MSKRDLITNLSSHPDQVIFGWLERVDALRTAKKVICLPDTCPGKSPLPTGTGYLTESIKWRKYALSDVGCGIVVVRTQLTLEDTQTTSFRGMWDDLCKDLSLRRNKGFGDLGSGNHFVDAVASYEDGSICIVVHTGSRKESGLVDNLVDSPLKFDTEFQRIKEWAKSNREAVLEIVHKHVGQFIDLCPGLNRLDRNHNHFEEVDDGVLIRKGAQRVEPGEYAVIPSNLLDDMVLVRATSKVSEIYNCLPHGTGRMMSRSAAKGATGTFDFEAMRQQVYIPEQISDASLRTEAPICYRPLDVCLELVSEYIDVVERFVPVAYIGQL